MKTLCVLLCAAAAFAQLRVDSVIVDSVWNSDSASRVSRDCRVSFIPQGTGQVHAVLSVSSDGGSTWWNHDSAFALNGGLVPIMACGVKRTVIVRVLGGDRDNFVVRIRIRQPNPAHWPAWRKAMTLPNTIYNISDNTAAGIQFTFPGGSVPLQFDNSDCYGMTTGQCIIGYGGGVHCREVGDYGVITYGSGGHNFVGNQVGDLNLNGDVAHYEVWQQPIYSMTPGTGVEFYWSPAAAAALPANRRFANQYFSAGSWDGGFPIAIDGWVYPAAVKYVEVGPGIPTGQYRYDQECYIPSQYTGLGTGVWFIPANIFTAPGFQFGIDGAICTDKWPSGGKKYYSHYQREDNKAWAHTSSPVPSGMAPGAFYPNYFGGSAGFCEKHRKVVVPAGSNCEVAVYDVGSGVANGTWSWKSVVVKNSWCDPRLGKSAMSNGHPRNRAFYAWFRSGGQQLLILDLDDPTYPLYSPSFPTMETGSEQSGLHYSPALDKFILYGLGSGPLCQKITIPDDLANTAGYTLENISLSLASGVSMSGTDAWAGHVQYIESLNCIVLMGVSTPAKAFWVQ